MPHLGRGVQRHLVAPLGFGGLRGTRGPGASLADISGLRRWFASTTLALADGDPVSTWPDASSEAANLTQATTSRKPTFRAASAPGGQGCVEFDGVDDFLTGARVSLTTQATFAVVMRVTSPVPYGIIVAQSNGDFSSTEWEVRRYALDDAIEFVSEIGGFQQFVSGTLDLSVWHIAIIIVDTTAATMHFLNGVANGSGAWAPPGTLPTWSLPLLVGARREAAPQFPVAMQMAELAIWDRALLTAERELVEQILGTKYGITV